MAGTYSDYQSYFISDDDKKVLDDNNVTVFADVYIGGGKYGHVFAGKFKSSWTRKYKVIDDDGQETEKTDEVPADQSLAIKIVEFDPTGEAFEKTRPEVENLKSISHKNVVTMFKAFWNLKYQTTGQLYIIMERADKTLEEFLTPYRRRDQLASKLREATAKYLTLDIISGLGAIFHRGRYHSDLHNDNFLVFKRDNRDMIKVADLGLAKHKPDKEQRWKGQRKDLLDASMAIFAIEDVTQLSSESRQMMGAVRQQMQKVPHDQDPAQACGELRNHDWFKEQPKKTKGLKKSVAGGKFDWLKKFPDRPK